MKQLGTPGHLPPLALRSQPFIKVLRRRRQLRAAPTPTTRPELHVYGEFPAACGPTYVSQVEITRLHDDVYLHGRNYHPGGQPCIAYLTDFIVRGLPFRAAFV